MGQDYSKNPKIKLGNVALGPEYQEKKNHKLRITCWIDGDIYDELSRRADAGEAGGKYQALLNQLLRTALFPERKNVETERDILDAVVTLDSTLRKLIEGSLLKVHEPVRSDKALNKMLRRNSKRKVQV